MDLLALNCLVNSGSKEHFLGLNYLLSDLTCLHAQLAAILCSLGKMEVVRIALTFWVTLYWTFSEYEPFFKTKKGEILQSGRGINLILITILRFQRKISLQNTSFFWQKNCLFYFVTILFSWFWLPFFKNGSSLNQAEKDSVKEKIIRCTA